MGWTAIAFSFGVWLIVALSCGATDIHNKSAKARRMAWTWPLTMLYYLWVGHMLTAPTDEEVSEQKRREYRAQALKNAAAARTAAKRYLNANFDQSALTFSLAAVYWDAVARDWASVDQPLLQDETTLLDVPSTGVEDTPEDMRTLAS